MRPLSRGDAPRRHRVATSCINWFPRAVHRLQHGLRRARHQEPRDRRAGVRHRNAPEEELAANRHRHRAGSSTMRSTTRAARARRVVKVKVPFLSAANWGGQGLHTRGNFEGFVTPLRARSGSRRTAARTGRASTPRRRSSCSGASSAISSRARTPAGTPAARRAQDPPSGEKFVERHENEWPLARTRWTRFYLNPGECSLARASLEFRKENFIRRRRRTVLRITLQESMEITGPAAAKLWLSSDTADADVFLALRVFSPEGAEVTFQGSNDPRVPVGLGWLRASHRKLDPQKSLPYRPWHTHDEFQDIDSGRGGGARCRNLAHQHRDPRGFSLRARGARQATTNIPARRSRSRESATSSQASVLSCTTIRATGRRKSSAAPTRCTSSPGGSLTCCFR